MPAKKSTLSIAEAQELVHTEGADVFATSRELAEHFKKRHDTILRKIENLSDETFNHLKIAAVEYLDKKGELRKEYRLNRDAFSFVAMSLTGADADEWKLKYISAFNLMEEHIRHEFANPPRTDILRDKRKAHNPMMDALVQTREDLGKETKAFHYINENKLCNWVVTGQFDKIDEKALSNEDAQLLSAARNLNEAYLLDGMDRNTRKAKLNDFALRRRTKRLTTKV